MCLCLSLSLSRSCARSYIDRHSFKLGSSRLFASLGFLSNEVWCDGCQQFPDQEILLHSLSPRNILPTWTFIQKYPVYLIFSLSYYKHKRPHTCSRTGQFHSISDLFTVDMWICDVPRWVSQKGRSTGAEGPERVLLGSSWESGHCGLIPLPIIGWPISEQGRAYVSRNLAAGFSCELIQECENTVTKVCTCRSQRSENHIISARFKGGNVQ